MGYKNVLNLLLLISCLVVPLSRAMAHDPGMSRSSVQLLDTGLSISMAFSRQDLESLLLIDADYNGTVTVNEFSAVQSRLQVLIPGAVVVQQADVSVLPVKTQLEQADDAVNVYLLYETPRAAVISIQLPLLGQLPRGHRQYLTVQGMDGELQSQHILSADSLPVLLETTGHNTFPVFLDFIVEGIWHIWIGFDHILFLLTLLLPAVLVYKKSGWQSVDDLRPAVIDTLKIVTAFTLAHSITLALAVLDIFILPSRLVESVIAFSVLVTAVNNLWPVFPASRWLLAFGFGLIHGFGFAGVLLELGLPGGALVPSLLGFNLGVEAGQLAIVLLVFPVAAVLRHTILYRTWIFTGGSTVAALIAVTWMIERIFDFNVPGV